MAGAASTLRTAGFCWSLMLVMFGVGISSLTAMLVLGALTAIEKNLPRGRRLTRPLGVVLVVAAVYSVAA
jgi:predicted metal-binding membrane protein